MTTGHNARDLSFTLDAAAIVGVKSRGYNITHDMIDVTTDDDVGWRTLLDTPGLRSVEITLGIIGSTNTLLTALFALAAGEIVTTLPSSLAVPGNITGDFLLASVEYTGDSDGVLEVSATFMSSGAVVYTASAAA
jgi:predicted secreted protein